MEEINEKDLQQSYLSFRLGEEIFAANVSQVLEILEIPVITRIPHSPHYMRGIINLGGKVLPVLDTRLKFGLDAEEDTIATRIIVVKILLDGLPIEIGALVDSVEEETEITENQIEPLPFPGFRIYSSFIKGMVRNKDKYVIILQMDKVFTELEISQAKFASGKIAKALNT
jgi:purine-binding chemotaxis protein CheW